MLCNFALEETLRGKIYSALVLTVLLYGSKVLCLREDLLAKLLLHPLPGVEEVLRGGGDLEGGSIR